ncbi:phytoene/squalene synthase family protein [Rhodococcus erythropolis]|uniref:phytoene/squalene synthase family protein n=1 Tax=Rhodococcus erythropolis TaxID=1833 RepID=UPI001E59AD87|nr:MULTISPECIES: phytoene/squalene synthase family protein [Rhodococcus erythropolis group]MCD2104803.1 phytoene/squalene synthase family protein [Rhodococcus qingshengii]MCZ4525069.1 phytoene/squalene synthase family protein [Rhodococcus erythropolis]
MNALSASYGFCEGVTKEHGRTYFLAARLLPEPRRRAVHALYAFARIVDDVVDEPSGPHERGTVLADVERATFTTLDAAGIRDLPATIPSDLSRVLPAFADAVQMFDIPRAYFEAFFESMRMDAPDTAKFRPVYNTMDELGEYMYGSAVVIGLQMLPILGVSVPQQEAVVPASNLGEAFQLTNFIRDVGEDLDRGRLYLPANEFAAFGVDIEMLEHGRRTGTVDVRVKRALAHFIAVTRGRYRSAESGIPMLDRRVQPSIHTAFVLYGAILDQVERADFRILHRRVSVPGRTRLRVAAPGLVRSATYAAKSRRG